MNILNNYAILRSNKIKELHNNQGYRDIQMAKSSQFLHSEDVVNYKLIGKIKI